MKFDFSQAQYVKMFEESFEGREIISYILADPNMIRANYDLWKTYFPVDTNTLAIANDGTSALKIFARDPEHATIADMRAPGGVGRLGEEGRSEFYTISFADIISVSWQERAHEREQKERIFQEFGNDAPLLLGYATEVLQPRIDGINMALTNLAMQAMSTGKCIFNFGRGIQNVSLYSVPIPTANKTTAGAKVWADEDCNLLDQIVELKRHYVEDVFGRPDMEMELDVTYEQFKNVFLKNKQVIDTIKLNFLIDNGQLISQRDAVPAALITEEAFNKYCAGRFPDLPQIRVISEHQRDGEKIIHGWKDGIAVLRPAGIAGHTFRSEIAEKVMQQKYGNSLVSKIFTTTADGMVTVVNTVSPDGSVKKWATDVIASATPALENYLYHVLIDTTTAD
jgi:hypothetical protein